MPSPPLISTSESHLMKPLIIALSLFFSFGFVQVKAQNNSLATETEAKLWHGEHDVSSLKSSAQGLEIDVTGDDPFLVRDPLPISAKQPYWVTLRLKSVQSGVGQLFWFPPGGNPTETYSIHFPVKGGEWREVRLPLPAFSQASQKFRIDPPGIKGNHVVLASFAITPRILIVEPLFWKLENSSLTGNILPRLAQERVLKSGNMEVGTLTHSTSAAYLKDGKVVWFPLGKFRENNQLAKNGNGDDKVVFVWKDPDGGTWTLTEILKLSPLFEGVNEVRSELRLSQKRDVLFFPVALLFAKGDQKTKQIGQSLFAGLEYLASGELSSSEKDIIGGGAKRLSPSSYKVTIPLMATAANGNYTGISWEPSPDLQPIFEVPDRHFKTNRTLFGLVYPGTERESDRLLPDAPTTLEADTPVFFHYEIHVGKGNDVTPALQSYVGSHPLPNAPAPVPSRDAFTRLMSAGWLTSQLKEPKGYRHAYPGSFGGQRAADATMFLDWIAENNSDQTLRGKARTASLQERNLLTPEAFIAARVGHIGSPAPALVNGKAEESLEVMLRRGKDALARFQKDGSLPFALTGESAGLGKTHDKKSANGVEARAVLDVLESAAYTGDAGLKQEGLRLLDRLLAVYRGDVPRGAQTWEVPLHTPDILASALLVRCFTLGFDLTGEERYLKEATYWAWTGLPFVYLVSPTNEPIGIYSTIAVYGATQFRAPNWMGLPVQWCGLVYADTLYFLAERTKNGFWKQIADNITLSGIQQTWQLGQNPEREGLLPDSFDLQAQSRNDVAINPATLMACAVRLYGVPIYDSQPFVESGTILHAPGKIEHFEENRKDHTVSVGITSWKSGAFQAILSGVTAMPEVTINDKKALAGEDYTYLSARHCLILNLKGTTQLTLKFSSGKP